MLGNQAEAIQTIIHRINATVDQITHKSTLVKGNLAQCRRLAERAQLVREAVNPFVDAQNVTPSQRGVYLSALQSLHLTLQLALALLTQCSEDRSWVRSLFFDTKGQLAKLEELSLRLSHDLQQLSLLQVAKQMKDAKQDREDRERDYQALLAQQASLAAKAQEAKNDMQQLAMDESKRQEMMTRQMDSFRYAIEQMQPGRPIEDERERVLTELRIPFYQLSIDNLIAESALGRTYLGRYWEQTVAIKLIDRPLTEAERREFLREVQIMYRLRSDYVVPLYAVCDEPDRACIVTKHMAQGTLRNVLNTQPHLSPKERHRIALDVALGLYYLHGQDLLHRNLNSSTILMDEAGHAALAEFGLSKNTQGNISTLEQRSESALQWMPPEVVMGTIDWHGYSAQSDIYSFGMVLWEILTGKVPFAGKTPAQLARALIHQEREVIPDNVPPLYRELIQGCWQEQPFDRPSLDKILHDLRAYRVPEATANPQSGNRSAFWQVGNAHPPIDPEVFYLAARECDRQKDYKSAITYYQRAIEEGNHTKAKTYLGMVYMLGNGVPQDKVKANSLLIAAAREGHTTAMQNLAHQYETGDGVPKDKEQAQAWRELFKTKSAADKGDERASERYRLLLSSSQYGSQAEDSMRSLPYV